VTVQHSELYMLNCFMGVLVGMPHLVLGCVDRRHFSCRRGQGLGLVAVNQNGEERCL